MSLNGAKLICLHENGEQGEIIEAKGRSFKFGYYMNSDYILKSSLAKNIHCEINCDAFGRVTIRNHCPDNPIRVNGSTIYLKRPLLSGSRITVLDKEFLWSMEKNSAQDEPSTPKNNVTKPEQAPSSCPNLVPHKDARSRLTIHSFGYSIKSDEHGNRENDDDDDDNENENENENSNDVNEKGELLLDRESSSDKENVCISKILEVKQKNNENKEMIKIHNTHKNLSKFNQSDVLITSFSPRETGIKIERSFTALIKPSITTPKNFHGTPRKVLSEIHDDASMDLVKFSTPSTSKVKNTISKNTSMHLLDLTTPTKLTPASKSAHKSVGKVIKRQPKTPLGVPPLSAIIKPSLSEKILEDFHSTSSSYDQKKPVLFAGEEIGLKKIVKKFYSPLKRRNQMLVVSKISPVSVAKDIEFVSKKNTNIVDEPNLKNVISNLTDDENKLATVSEPVSKPVDKSNEIISIPKNESFSSIKRNHNLLPEDGIFPLNVTFSPVKEDRPNLNETFSPVKELSEAKGVIDTMNVTFSPIKETNEESVKSKDSIISPEKQVITSPPKLNQTFSPKDRDITSPNVFPSIEFDNKNEKMPLMSSNNITKESVQLIKKSPIIEKTPKKKIIESVNTKSNCKKTNNENSNLNLITEAELKDILKIPKILVTQEDIFNDTEEGLDNILKTLESKKLSINSKNDVSETVGLLAPKKEIFNEDDLLDIKIHVSPEKVFDDLIGKPEIKHTYTRKPSASFNKTNSDILVSSNLPITDIQNWVDSLDDFQEGIDQTVESIFSESLAVSESLDGESLDKSANEQRLELERAFENFEKEPTIPDSDRKAKTPEPEKPQLKISRMTLDSGQVMDGKFDLNAEKQKLELERAFENFKKEPAIPDADRKAKTPEPEKPQSKFFRMTLGNRQKMDEKFDLNVEKQKLELERAFENFEKKPIIPDTNRKAKTPEPVKPQSKISRMTLDNRQEIDGKFDLNAEKQKLELERAFENFKKEPAIPDADRKAKTPEPEKPQSKFFRMTLGNRQKMDEKFDLNVEKQKLELERAFENFEKKPIIPDTNRKAKTPEPVKPQSKISRMTLDNRQEIDGKFDLNAEKQKLELERAFENFKKEPAIPNADQKAKTPEPEKPQSKIFRMTLGNRQKMDEKFDLNVEKQKLELERAFENFEKKPIIPDTNRKAKTPEPEKPQSKIFRMTLGNRQKMDEKFDLNVEKQKLELERAFENFEKEPIIPDTNRKAKTPEPEKPQSKIFRMTLGNRQKMDEKFDLNVEKQKLELERAFENFEKEPIIPDTNRKAKTPEPEKPQSKIFRMTLGNRQKMDEKFDLNVEKQKLELERAFENFEKEPIIPDTNRKAKTPEPEKPQSKIFRMTLGNENKIDPNFDLNAEKHKLELQKVVSSPSSDVQDEMHSSKIASPLITLTTSSKRKKGDISENKQTSPSPKGKQDEADLEVFPKNRRLRTKNVETTVVSTRTTRRGQTAPEKVKTDLKEDDGNDNQNQKSAENFKNPADMETSTRVLKQTTETRKTRKGRAAGKKLNVDKNVDENQEQQQKQPEMVHLDDTVLEDGSKASVSVSRSRRVRRLATIDDMETSTPVAKRAATRKGRAASKQLIGDSKVDKNQQQQQQPETINLDDSVLKDGSNASVVVSPKKRRARRLATIDDMETSTPVVKRATTRKGRAASKQLIGDSNVDENQQQPGTMDESVLEDGSNASVAVSQKKRRARRLVTIDDIETSTPVVKRATTRKGRAAGKKLIANVDDNQQQPESIHLNDTVLDDGSNASVSVSRSRRARRVATIDNESPKSPTVVRQTTRKGRTNANAIRMDDTISQKADSPVTIVQETTKRNGGKERKKDQLSEQIEDIPKLKKTKSIKKNMKRRSGDELETENHTDNSKNRKKNSSISSDSQTHTIEHDVAFTDNTDEVEKSSTKVQKTTATRGKCRPPKRGNTKIKKPIVEEIEVDLCSTISKEEDVQVVAGRTRRGRGAAIRDNKNDSDSQQQKPKRTTRKK